MKKDYIHSDYQIVGIHQDYVLVMGTSYESPLSKLPQIEKDLRSKRYKGRIIFDLLLSNGKSSNRYVYFSFDSDGFDKQSFQVLPKADRKLINESRDFFMKNKELLEHGVLTEQERFSILYP